MKHIHEQLANRSEDDKGFTLIELLVVVIIIGILAAIAIPVFLNQREKAWDAAAKSDVRNAQTALETAYTDSTTYVGAVLADNGFAASANVSTVFCSTLNGYLLGSKHASSDNVFYFSSEQGQLTGPVTAAVYNALAAATDGIPCDSTDL